MKKFEKNFGEQLGKAFLIFSFATALFMILLVFGIIRFIFQEDICTKKAEKIVGNNWGKLINANEYEKEHFYSAIQEKDKIYWGVSEQLKCERELKYFFVF